MPPRTVTPLPRERVVYLDRDVVVVDKPSGVLSTPEAPGEVDTLLERVQDYLRRTRAPGPTWKALKPVHRIDRGTTGLLVFARHEVAWQVLKRDFRAHAVTRRYLALVHGVLAAPRTFASDLARDRGDGTPGSIGRLRGVRHAAGKHAVTHVTPLRQLKGATLLECRLETGRTNQIRIHLSEAGHPLLGEALYLRDFPGPVLPAPRLALHAAHLGFTHPRTGRHLEWSSPLPEDLATLVHALEAAPNPPGAR
jgi:23S rRNA pseudouridine1911/1915/1917 synthase